MNDADRFFLTHIAEEISVIEKLLPGLTLDLLMEDIVCKHCIQKAMEIIGEAAKRLSDETKEQCPEINWTKYRRLRNRLTHEYFSIDWDLIWDILQNDISELKKCVNKLLK